MKASKPIKRAHLYATTVLVGKEDKNGVMRYSRRRTDYVPLKTFARTLADTPKTHREPDGISDVAKAWLRNKALG